MHRAISYSFRDVCYFYPYFGLVNIWSGAPLLATKAANKDANSRKLDGNRILCDIERGRTRPDWRPRRLGKGLGKSRNGPSEPPPRPVRDEDRSAGKDRDREKRKRSRSRETKDWRRRSRSRDRKRSRSRDRKREPRGRYTSRRDDMSQYGEYGAEIRAEYNGDY